LRPTELPGLLLSGLQAPVRAGGRRVHHLLAAIDWVEERPLALACLGLLVAAGVVAVMAFVVAGPHAVDRAINSFEAVWLVPLIAAQAISFFSYTGAHRWAMTLRGRAHVTADTAMRVAAYGAAATSLRGGFSIDRRALRGAGATPRRAGAHVLGLGALEYAVLAPAAWVCALVLLDSPHVKRAVTVPWAIGVPAGALLALLWALHAKRSGPPAGHGRIAHARAVVLGGLELLGQVLRHPVRERTAWLAMLVHWSTEIASLWLALRMFGADTSVAVVLLAYATGYALTPRSLPLAGAGVTEALMPLALLWTGVPIGGAVLAVLAYRLLRLMLSIPPALVARERVQQLLARARTRAASPR
jgi:uncharacterized membrane protein YbhN (UPF0104 family)